MLYFPKLLRWNHCLLQVQSLPTIMEEVGTQNCTVHKTEAMAADVTGWPQLYEGTADDLRGFLPVFPLRRGSRCR
ncbi:hypothetical protein Y1Q_0018992 [Alligator mississippiensis]|uniref:Uncharacterized protein n=1 Tax=Alligator mississippiensis TaxID=8496 RepID=A0A151M3E1_ALLMI|nr:hypothetical protein Y1Q_0018992 [Alligator mississippiensis]